MSCAAARAVASSLLEFEVIVVPMRLTSDHALLEYVCASRWECDFF